MKNIFIICLFVFSMAVFSNSVRAIPLGDLPHESEPSLQASDSQILLPVKEIENDSGLLNRYSSIPEGSLENESGASKDKHNSGSNDTEFYLFEQEELDAQKPGLELYQSLAPLLTPEMKKDAKKIWAKTADFRDAIDFSTNDTDAKELTLQQSTTENSLLSGVALEEMTNKNLPPTLSDKNEPDKAMVRELFDGIYDLIKNALFIIIGVLVLGKLITIIAKKIMADSEKRKKKKVRRHSKRHRKKRRRSYA